MKRILKNLLLGIVVISLFSYTYIKLLKVSVVAVVIILSVICLYGVCMGICEGSMKQLKKIEMTQKHFGLAKKERFRVLLFSLTTLAPFYFLVLLFSLIPMFTYEVWFITIFPCILFISLPMSSVLDEYHTLTQKKLPFIVSFTVILVTLMLIGMTVTSMII